MRCGVRNALSLESVPCDCGNQKMEMHYCNFATTSTSSWYGSYSALGFPVLQHLEPVLNYRDVNFLSISLDIALSPPQQVVVVACGLTLLHATPLEFCHLLTTMLALCQPYSGENRSLKYVPWACYPVWLRRGLTTQDEGMQLDHAPYHSM